MTPTSPKLDQVVKILESKGATEEQIMQVLTEVAKTAFAKLYTEAMTSFTEEDLQAIEKATTQEEANFEIMTRYSERTGKNAQEVLQNYYDIFADKFLEEAKKEETTTSSVPR